MKRFLSLFLVFTFLTFSFTQKSEAGVGLILKNKTVKVVGGVATATSVGMFGIGAIVANATSSWAALGFAVLGLYTIPLALIILDEENADLKFKALTPEQGLSLGVSNDKLEAYNNEVDELNAVKEEIEAQVTEKTSDAVIGELWKDHASEFSPGTMEVAAKVVIATFAK